MCKRNSPDNKEEEKGGGGGRKKKKKKETSTGCVRETPHVKVKLARDVSEELPR